MLHKISKEENRALAIVSHDMTIMDIANRVMRLEDGELHEGPEFLVADPVCGMTLAKEKAAATERSDGKDYCFCSNACRDQFVVSPQLFMPGSSSE